MSDFSGIRKLTLFDEDCSTRLLHSFAYRLVDKLLQMRLIPVFSIDLLQFFDKESYHLLTAFD